MANPDWKSRDSEDAKMAQIGMPWGTEVDTHLWYDLGDIGQLTAAEQGAIVAECFVSGKANFGDVEIHRQTKLRLRGKLRLRAALTVRGKYCPLYQVGHYDPSGRPTTPLAVHFPSFWEEDPEPGDTEPDLSRLTSKKR